MSQNLENTAENSNQGLNSSEVQDKAVNSLVPIPVTPAADRTPFVSRFNQWMKVIAIVVIATFVPDQISWSFGYNPAVLYRNLPTMYAMQDTSMPMPKPAMQVAGSLEYLLKQIQNKPNLRLQLNLDENNRHPERSEGSHQLIIDTKTTFTADKIHQITEWLKTPNLNVLNCGVYALKDVLEANGIKRSLSEISVMTLSVDIMADIIKIGEPKLKTTLFAINKTAKALGLNYESLKLSPKNTLDLKTPFIAHFKNEHFVTVQKAAGGKVYYTDLGYPRIVDQQDFLNNIDGFVFAQVPPVILSPKGEESQLNYQLVPAPLQAFVWGDKWRDLSKSLPGIMSGGSLALQLCIDIGLLALSFTGVGAALKIGTVMTEFSLQLGNLMNALGTICVMKGACSQDEAFILSMAITVGVTMGVGALGPAQIAGGLSASAVQVISNGSGAEAAASITQAVASSLPSWLQHIVDAINKFEGWINKGLGSLFGGAVTTTAATTATRSAFTKFIENFSIGLVLGAAKGVAELEITKAIDNAFCPSSASTCSDQNQILEQAVGAIANIIGAQLAVLTTAYVANGITDTTAFTSAIGVQTQAQRNAQAAVNNANNSANSVGYDIAAQEQNGIATQNQLISPLDAAIVPIQQDGIDVQNLSISPLDTAIIPVSQNVTYAQYGIDIQNQPISPIQAQSAFWQANLDTAEVSQAAYNQVLSQMGSQDQAMKAAVIAGQNYLYNQTVASYSGASASAPVEFGTAVAQAMMADLPNIVGQVASMTVRLAALKWAGVGAQDNLSNALGMGANMIASTATQNVLTPKQQTPLSVEITRGLFAVGLGFAENSVIGRYNQTEARENPAYSYDYSNAQAQFEGMTLVASSVLSAGLLATFPNLMPGVGGSGTGQSWGTTFKQILLTGSPSNATPIINPTGNGLQTTTVPPADYSPSMIMNFAQGFGGAQLLNETGSWGSVKNFVDYSDIQDQMTGFTADAAVSADNSWKEMKANNKTTYSVGRTVGNLIDAQVTPAVSLGTLRDQFLLSLLESRSLGAPGINVNYLEGELQNAAITSVENMTSVGLYAMAKALERTTPIIGAENVFPEQGQFTTVDGQLILKTRGGYINLTTGTVTKDRMTEFLLNLGLPDFQFAVGTDGNGQTHLGIGQMEQKPSFFRY